MVRRTVPLLASWAVLEAAGCAAAPSPPAPGTGTLWGIVRLVPKEGVPATSGGGAYGDRALRDVKQVDYSRPGFAVVYLEGAPPLRGQAVLTLEGSRYGPRFDRSFHAVGLGGTLKIKNADGARHTISCPGLSFLKSLRPGEETEVSPREAGALTVFAVDLPELEAKVFASSGPFAVAGEFGHWELRDLPPGERTLRVWHPRFPGPAQRVRIEAGAIQRFDLEVGVHQIGR